MDFNLADINEAVSAAVGDREAIVFRRPAHHLRASSGARSRQLAHVLLDAGFTVHAERDELEGWQSGQDHLALYLHNGNEYLEGMLGAYQARAVPFNVNYRYVSEELRYLLADSEATRHHLPLRLRPDARGGAGRPAPTSSCSCRCPTTRATSCCPAPAGTRRRWPPRPADAPAGATPPRRPLHPLHRRHHRHAQGRAVASGRHLPRGAGRP